VAEKTLTEAVEHLDEVPEWEFSEIKEIMNLIK